MRILGIETSCDETGVAIYDSKDGLPRCSLSSGAACGIWRSAELASRDHAQNSATLKK